jgi:SAM-dependent methyltransferase
MAFEVADAYDRFMGRYSVPLAPRFADFAGVVAGAHVTKARSAHASTDRVLDVGCGPGALTAELVHRVGAPRVLAADPSAPFVAAARQRCPGVEVVQAGAESLPWPDDTVEVALAQLVVHFMTDPVGGLREMGRVTRPGGTVAACVWDLAGASGPLSPFWAAVHDVAPDAPDESVRPGATEGDLGRLCVEAGLVVVDEGSVEVSVAHPSFAQWWEPYTLGVGPAGDFVAEADAATVEAVRRRCLDRLGDPPAPVRARAWAVRARVPGS